MDDYYRSFEKRPSQELDKDERKLSTHDKLDLLSQDIEDFIKRYQPSTLVEPIGKFTGCYIEPEAAGEILKAFRDGNLEEYLDKHSKFGSRWYFKEAIQEYFKQGKHERCARNNSFNLDFIEKL